MNNTELTARGLINIGAILYLQKNYKQSLITLNQALKLANAIEDEALLGDINSELGILYGYLGEEKQANDYFEQSYHHFKKAGKHNYALNSLHNVANNHSNQERYEQALEVYRILESEILPNTSNHFIAGIYRNIAWALVNQKEPDTESAYRYIILAGEYVKEVEQHAVKLQYIVDKAFVLEKMERYQEALDNLAKAQTLLALKDSNIYDTSELNILFLRAKLQYVLGDYSQAIATQSTFFTKSIAYKKARETNEVDELILQYESETAQRHKHILEKKQRLQDLQLQQMTDNANSREILVIVLAVCTLLLAWFLLRVITGQKNLVRVTRIDNLTGVINRRRLLELGDDLFLQAKKEQQAFSVYMIDIDFFKKINDQFGHSIGDKALQEVAVLGQNLMRASDVFGRFGGEEFIALLPNTQNNEALEVAQRLRQHIEQKKWQTLQINQLTISIGVATFENDNYADFSLLLKAADEQLLKAKQAGRNKVSSDA
jgi:diguanylate cyclase (GGDEF)-like protein